MLLYFVAGVDLRGEIAVWYLIFQEDESPTPAAGRQRRWIVLSARAAATPSCGRGMPVKLRLKPTSEGALPDEAAV